MIAVSFFAFYALALLVGFAVGAAGTVYGQDRLWRDLPADEPTRILPPPAPAPAPAPAQAVHWRALEAVAAQVETRTLIRNIVRQIQAEC